MSSGADLWSSVVLPNFTSDGLTPGELAIAARLNRQIVAPLEAAREREREREQYAIDIQEIAEECLREEMRAREVEEAIERLEAEVERQEWAAHEEFWNIQRELAWANIEAEWRAIDRRFEAQRKRDAELHVEALSIARTVDRELASKPAIPRVTYGVPLSLSLDLDVLERPGCKAPLVCQGRGRLAADCEHCGCAACVEDLAVTPKPHAHAHCVCDSCHTKRGGP